MPLHYGGLRGEKMTTKIFVNLPVKDLKRSMEFFTKLGFLRIPTQIGHPFRFKPAGHSDANRPPSG